MTINPDFIERLRAWSYRRQHLDRSALDPATLLDHLVAIYSSHPSGPLTLQSRTPKMSATTISDWESNRAVVRIPGLRGSIFLVPLLFAPAMIAATRTSFSGLLNSLKYAGMTLDDYEALKPRLLDILADPLPVAAIKYAVPDAPQVMTAVRVMAHEGLLLRLGSSLRRDDLRYVATEHWLGAAIAEVDPEQARTWLADAYLRAFGPARVADFAWWSGCSIRNARAALGACETVDLGSGYLLPSDLIAAFNGVAPLSEHDWAAIPKWDAYTMGHAPDGRQRWVADNDLTKAFSLLGKAVPTGDSLPLLLHRGQAVASWSHRFDGDIMQITVKPFAQLDRPDHSLFAQIGALFGVSEPNITVETVALG